MVLGHDVNWTQMCIPVNHSLLCHISRSVFCFLFKSDWPASDLNFCFNYLNWSFFLHWNANFLYCLWSHFMLARFLWLLCQINCGWTHDILSPWPTFQAVNMWQNQGNRTEEIQYKRWYISTENDATAISPCSPRPVPTEAKQGWDWHTWMGDLPGKTRLLLEEVLVRPAGGAHPVVCVGPNAPV